MRFKVRLILIMLCVSIGITAIPQNVEAGIFDSLGKFFSKIFVRKTDEVVEQIEKNGKNAKKSKSTLRRGTAAQAHFAKKVCGNLGGKNGWAAHHLIPFELVGHSALGKVGLDVHGKSNGVCLPRNQNVSQGKLPVHSGKHTDYSSAVKKSLDCIPKGASPQKTLIRIKKLQGCLKSNLSRGNPLHKKHGNTTNIWSEFAAQFCSNQNICPVVK